MRSSVCSRDGNEDQNEDSSEVNLTDNLYYPWIETPYGQQLYHASTGRLGRNSVNIVAHLQYMNEDVVTNDNCQVLWFVRDSSVMESISRC